MMIGCVVGRDKDEVARAARALAQPERIRRRTTALWDDRRSRDAAREYEAVGVQRAMLQHLDHEDVEMVAVLGEVATRLTP